MTTYTYFSGGWLKSIQDPEGFLTSYIYDPTIKNRLTQITYPAISGPNPMVTLTYDSYGNLATRKNERGFTTSFQYDALNRRTQKTLPADSGPNPVFQYKYDAASNLTTITDPFSKATTLQYDALNRKTSQTTPLGHTTGYTFDNNSMLRAVTDPLQHTITNSYDAANRLVGVTNALGLTMVYNYDAAGQRIAVTDPLNHTTSYSYLPRGWLGTVTSPLSTPSEPIGTNYAYDANGNQLTETLQDGLILDTDISTAYDTLNRMTRLTEPTPAGSRVTTTAYDRRGNPTTIQQPLPGSPNPATTTNTYDARSHLSTVTDALNHITTYSYDLAENRIAVQDPLQRTTTTVFDAQNRVKATIQPDPRGPGFTNTPITTITYDLLGRQQSVQDPVGNLTVYNYDDDSRLTSTQDPNNKLTTTMYDNADRLTAVTDRSGRQRTFGYDNANRRTGEQWFDTTHTLLRTFTYMYDAANRLTQAQDSDSLYNYLYDAGDRLTSVDNVGAPGGVPALTLTYSYDGFDNRLSARDSRQGGFDYGYDSTDHHSLTSAAQNNAGVQGANVVLGYDIRSRLTSVVRSPGGGLTFSTFQSNIAYDALDRVTGVNHTFTSTNTTTTLANYTYHLDQAGQLDQSTSTGAEGNLTYSYDSIGQLTRVWSNGSAVESYSYDNNGNRTGAGTYTYGPVATGNRLTYDGVSTYTYDAEGNLSTKVGGGQSTTYTWDNRNRLVEAVQTVGTVVTDVKFTYDVNNRRIRKQVVGGATTWTFWDQDNPYADFDNSGTLTTRYLYGRQVDQLFGKSDASGNNVLWYLPDRLGSVRQTADSGGNILGTVTYDAYGNIRSQSGNTDRFLYTSREWMAEIGLQFSRARYYDPRTGRWISEDPLGFKARDPNLYRYVFNSATNYTDPSGELIPLLLVLGVAGAVLIWPGEANPPPGRPPRPGRPIEGAVVGMSVAVVLDAAPAAIAWLFGTGTAAVVAPGLSAGTYPALLVDGVVYVARMHEVAWQMSGRGDVQKYGMAVIDASGKFVKWAYE